VFHANSERGCALFNRLALGIEKNLNLKAVLNVSSSSSGSCDVVKRVLLRVSRKPER
jgi:hypothetical protein